MTVPGEDRLHALDAARALALLLGIALHATMAFFLPIPVQDPSSSVALAVAFYVIHIFRMSLFFVLAGFFARQLLHRRGARAFVKDRALRILVPMTVGWVLLAPPTLAILIYAVSLANPQAQVGQGTVAPVAQGFPLIHLWFLYYLCLFYVIALGLRALLRPLFERSGALRARLDPLLCTALSSYAAPLWLAAPLCATLYFDPAWPLWFGITTPDIGLDPKLPAVVGFGSAFALGWMLQGQPTLLDLWRQRWPLHLAIAIGLTGVCLLLVGPLPPADLYRIAGAPWRRLLYALAYTLAIWYWVFALIGLVCRYCASPSPLRRYLADASYWLYLTHLPVVFGLHVLLRDWPMHWSLKFPLILCITLALLLVSYELLVRSTFIGEVLNGRRYGRGLGRTTPKRARSEPDAQQAEPALASLSGVSKAFAQVLALDALDFQVHRGELVALLGQNGAGKSTAIGLLLGALQPDSGTVRLLGGSPMEVQRRLGVGVMLQDVQLAPMLTAREHIALTSSYYRDPLSVAQTLDLAGIDDFAGQRYATLSGGQKRQVQFALAICGRPRLLFLDEPTVGLDTQARAALWRAIRTLVDEACAIVLTTHYLEEAEALADRVVVLAKGKRIAEGSVAQVRARVANARIRCQSAVDIAQIKQWSGVIEATREAAQVQILALDATAVVRRLMAADAQLSHLQVNPASLAEALEELTKENA